MTALAAAAAVFGVVMGVAPSLQLRRMLQLRSSRDVSLGFFAIAALGQLTWVIYGAALHNLAVIASNGSGMLINAAVFATAAFLRRPRARQAADEAGCP